ncbi:MAG: M81 family metallopeptidase, partial [Alphaproteobacteria bacterium]|nr:M81 family metallopeptidase [Alphaproteobacteria bacterium]
MPNHLTPKTIAIAGFQHETNTFGATRAGYDDFVMADSWPGLLIGEQVIDGVHGTTLPLAGFVAAAQKTPGINLHPILWCAAEPSAHVETEAFDRISAMILEGLAAAPRLDGVYLDLHGAMVTEAHVDGEGELLRRIRAQIGDDIPVSISLDSHANISPAMVARVDAITIFRSYPHLDMAETGGRAFHALTPLLDGKRRGMALRQVPFLIPLPDQYSEAEPLKGFYDQLCAPDYAHDYTHDHWLDFATGFPAADHEFTGPSIIAQAATQQDAEIKADAALNALLALELEITPSLVPARQAVARAIAESGPVILADVQDNPGAGSTSDTTGLLHELMAQNASGVILAMLNDPEVAAL